MFQSILSNFDFWNRPPPLPKNEMNNIRFGLIHFWNPSFLHLTFHHIISLSLFSSSSIHLSIHLCISSSHFSSLCLTCHISISLFISLSHLSYLHLSFHLFISLVISPLLNFLYLNQFIDLFTCLNQSYGKTRKSSCVNARGILPAV